MSALDVEYRNIAGMPGYRVGNDGSVWSCHRASGRFSGEWRRLAIRIRRPGCPYRIVDLRAEAGKGRVVRFYIHRLVLKAFIGLPPAGMQACHNDGDPANNRLENLRWDTCKSNAADKVRHGTTLVGENHPNAILSEELVAEICRLRMSGMKQIQIGKQVGCSQTIVSAVLLGKIWRSVERKAIPSFRAVDRPIVGKRLTIDGAREIVRLCRSGESRRDVATKYGVSPSLINQIMRGDTWLEATA